MTYQVILYNEADGEFRETFLSPSRVMPNWCPIRRDELLRAPETEQLEGVASTVFYILTY
jgi:hypothetical protein